MLNLNLIFRRSTKFVILISCIACCNVLIANAESNSSAELKFGVHLGLSTPNANINDIYNSDILKKSENDVFNFLRESAKLGYHLGIRGRFYLNETYQFIGVLLWNRFSESRIDVKDPTRNDTIIQTLFTNQNIVNIGAGMNIALNSGLIKFYGSGELNFNYLYNSVDLEFSNGVQLPLSLSPSYTRVGVGIGAGLDFDLKLILLNLETKYFITNIIGLDDNEKLKSFLAISFGVYF